MIKIELFISKVRNVSFFILPDPWGEVIATTDETESIVYADVDLSRMEEIRSQIPLTHQRRHDLYHLTEPTDKNRRDDLYEIQH